MRNLFKFPFHLLGGLIHFAVDVLMLVKTNIKKSIRIQLMLTFAVCSLAAVIAYGVSTNLFGEVTKKTYLDYSSAGRSMNNAAENAVRRLEQTAIDAERQAAGNRRIGSSSATAAVPSAQSAPDASASQAAGSSVQPAPPADRVIVQPAPSADRAAAQPAPPADQAPVQPSSPPDVAAAPASFGAGRIGDAEIRSVLSDVGNWNNDKLMIVDMDGNVLYKNKFVSETHVDMFSLLGRLYSADNRPNQEHTSVYPLELNGKRLLLVAAGYSEPEVVTSRGQSPLSVVAAIAVFIGLFYYMTRRKMQSIEELASGMREMARGRLDHRVPERSADELGSLAGHINMMAAELQRTLEEERRAERTKNELITNVSHDLRTPLTLIMGYLRLLKDKNYDNEAQAEQYLNITYAKSEKLKNLIEDLFEYTKLSNHGSPLQLESVCLNEMLDQLAEELVTAAENERLYLSRGLPPERLHVRMDPDKMIRVFENLLTNAIKYSLKPGEVKIKLQRTAVHALVCVSNRCPPLEPEQLERLFDRFYRVDTSRSSETGGSGLGLAIAKSIVEAHDGRIWADTEGGEIRFWVELPLAAALVLPARAV
jgi:signal transduction histidine kinase